MKKSFQIQNKHYTKKLYYAHLSKKSHESYDNFIMQVILRSEFKHMFIYQIQDNKNRQTCIKMQKQNSPSKIFENPSHIVISNCNVLALCYFP